MTAPPNKEGRRRHSARAAIVLTMDNMGEAADINRGLWPESKPVGSHYSVTEVLPRMIELLHKYDIPATYFIEAWNLGIYREPIATYLLSNSHEVAWHGWQHEPWSKLDATQERQNFARSFGSEGLLSLVGTSASEQMTDRVYRGLRPPEGIVHGERTFNLCKEFRVRYISPAGDKAAMIPLSNTGKKFTCREGKENNECADSSISIVILPFRWASVDAYFYMESFARLRELKGEYSAEIQPPSALVRRYIRDVEETIERGGFLSLLFHPFLTDKQERLDAFEEVLTYLAYQRNAGRIWMARCMDVEDWIRDNPGIVGNEPELDDREWR